MNKSFKARWQSENLGATINRVVLEPRLSALIHAPFVRWAGGLFLAPLFQLDGSRLNFKSSEAFQSITDYEAFQNHMHVEDLIEKPDNKSDMIRSIFRQGVRAAIELSDRLKMEGEFRVFLGLHADSDYPSVTLRFFGLRPHERPWGGDDPDKFKLEDILMIDV
jgi:hypothetical protein